MVHSIEVVHSSNLPLLLGISENEEDEKVVTWFVSEEEWENNVVQSGGHSGVSKHPSDELIEHDFQLV